MATNSAYWGRRYEQPHQHPHNQRRSSDGDQVGYATSPSSSTAAASPFHIQSYAADRPMTSSHVMNPLDDGHSPTSTMSSQGMGWNASTSAAMYPSSSMSFTADTSSPYSTSPQALSPYSFGDPYAELEELRRRIGILEQRHQQDKERIAYLESTCQQQQQQRQASPTFEAQWRLRTEARTRHFCSLNRAGNALCAWHDSRRERRQYPPRMAPQGVLNCGCTVDEALFEESLSRQGVGSYLPGETVRMDPALRNPLLRLLKERYGYRDGDFDRDRETGSWKPGEGPEKWIQISQLGGVNPRRPKLESERR